MSTACVIIIIFIVESLFFHPRKLPNFVRMPLPAFYPYSDDNAEQAVVRPQFKRLYENFTNVLRRV